MASETTAACLTSAEMGDYFESALLAFLPLKGVRPKTRFDFRTGTWYFGHTLVVIVLLAGLVLFAFHSALAGRSLFGKLLEET